MFFRTIWHKLAHQAKSMPDNEIIVRLFTVVLLVGFLIYMQWHRARIRAALRRQSQRPGEVIDVTPLRPRLEEVRRNYSAVAQAHARNIQAREGRVERARHALSRLPFFRRRHGEAEGEHHVA